jgi:hypothetical protein
MNGIGRDPLQWHRLSPSSIMQRRRTGRGDRASPTPSIPTPSIPRVFWDGTYTLTLKDDLLGLYDDYFETAGFGFAAERRNTQVEITGMPPGSGSVVVGSPFIRDNANAQTYNPEGFALQRTTSPSAPSRRVSLRTDQGFFLEERQFDRQPDRQRHAPRRSRSSTASSIASSAGNLTGSVDGGWRSGLARGRGRRGHLVSRP